ncbi:SubName: Full=Uncharacterized protein {ECO:0000313/EMBL:CCA68542.1} [Serendipita indica DSM 11827]|nr:SubName: Full=Uncharacterized protein {ECO:0000313/EMBL:CCA68542.1} [Serendipita indica DSM 11827]
MTPSMTLSEQYPLPDITDDALKTEVFTHKSEKRKLLVNQDRLAVWADIYGLPSRLQVHYSAELLLRQNTATKAKLFQAYVGALFMQSDRNYRTVEDWFGQLVEQGLEDIVAFENAANSLTEKLQTLKLKGPAEEHQPAQVPSSPSPSTSSTSSSNASYQSQLGSLALFNQICAQRNIHPDWQCNNMGSPHRPTHKATVRLSPTCEIVGTGVGGKKQEAKEKAAEEAMEKLGWSQAD